MGVQTVIAEEIREATKFAEAQHSQAKWFVQMYLLVLTGFAVWCGYFYKEFILLSCQPSSPAMSENLRNYQLYGGTVGVFFAGFTFAMGWVVMSVLSHKVATVVIVKKHLAFLRGRRLELAGRELLKGYVLPRRTRHVRLPGSTFSLPYVFFSINYLVLCGGIFISIAPFVGGGMACFAALLTGMIMGVYYPRLCVTYNLRLLAAIRSRTVTKMERRFRGLDSKRCSVWVGACLVPVVFLVLLFVAFCGVWVAAHVRSYPPAMLACAAIAAALFGVVRYWLEAKRRTKDECTIAKQPSAVPQVEPVSSGTGGPSSEEENCAGSTKG